MPDCSKCDLVSFCYSDPVTWAFESRNVAEQVSKRIRECHEKTLAELRKERFRVVTKKKPF
jgi:hypothetical protein